MFHMGKIRKQNILNIRPLFGHFWENSAKILPQICTAAPLTFLLGPFRVMRPKNWPVGNTAPVWPFELPNLKVKTPSFSEFPTGLAEKSAAGNHIRIFWKERYSTRKSEKSKSLSKEWWPGPSDPFKKILQKNIRQYTFWSTLQWYAADLSGSWKHRGMLFFVHGKTNRGKWSLYSTKHWPNWQSPKKSAVFCTAIKEQWHEIFWYPLLAELWSWIRVGLPGSCSSNSWNRFSVSVGRPSSPTL